MKVTYIYHSGVMIEGKNCVLLFDYWKGKLSLPLNKPLYIFVSHSHHDHFNPEVLKMDGIVIADRSIGNPGNEKIVFVQSGDVFNIEALRVSVYGSTDEGVSFMVETEGKRIFHSGDLNYWHWRDESTSEEIAEARRKFDAEIAMLPPLQPDLAMFPVDARMGNGFFEGAKIYIDMFKPTFFLPIHFTAHPEMVDEFAKEMMDHTKILRADLGVSIFEI
jgi:L-ascorbate metabolism protein UlaG (beta-lactamase superfamily)